MPRQNPITYILNRDKLNQIDKIINDEKNVGRIKLSKELGLGEGATRTLLKRLKKEEQQGIQCQ